jgi:hypothetical protein
VKGQKRIAVPVMLLCSIQGGGSGVKAPAAPPCENIDSSQILTAGHCEHILRDKTRRRTAKVNLGRLTCAISGLEGYLINQTLWRPVPLRGAALMR